MTPLVYWWCVFIVLAPGANLQSVDTLRFVHVVWRHGDRSPADPTFPTDTGNPEWSWPQGWGELSEIGMRQHYALGSYMRRRYVDTGFLPGRYNASQIYVRSSDYNRTIMSALANLAGMYPPEEDGQFRSDLYWQPIPVHAVPKDSDPMLWMDRPCPKAEDIYFNQVLKSDPAMRVVSENADLLTYLRQQSGHPIPTLNEVRFVYDPLNCERIHNDTHTWPGWVTMPLFESVQELHRLSKTFYYHDPRLQRFRGSLLFWDIAQRSQWKAQQDPHLRPPTLKYYAYSAHDTTMIALLENLGAYNGLIPPYATAMMFELHQRSGQYFIQIWYLNETNSQAPIPVPMKTCETLGECPLDVFVATARQQAPADWYSECGFEQRVAQDKYRRVSVAAEVLGASTALLLILLIITVAQLLKGSGHERIVG